MWATGVASVSWVLIQELTLSFSPPVSQCLPLTCLQQCLLFECSGFLLSLYLPLCLSLSCTVSEGLELSPHSLSGSCCGSLTLQCPLQLCLMLCCPPPPGSMPLHPLPSSLLCSSLCLPVCLYPLLLALPLTVSVAAICLYQSLSVISFHLSLLLSVFVVSASTSPSLPLSCLSSAPLTLPQSLLFCVSVRGSHFSSKMAFLHLLTSIAPGQLCRLLSFRVQFLFWRENLIGPALTVGCLASCPLLVYSAVSGSWMGEHDVELCDIQIKLGREVGQSFPVDRSVPCTPVIPGTKQILKYLLR